MYASIEGKGRVFAREHEGWKSYTLGVSSRDKEGKWKSAYQPIRFRTGEDVPNGTDISFKAFPSVVERTVDGKNRNYIVWQILNFSVAGEIPAEEPTGFTALDSEDIPF